MGGHGELVLPLAMFNSGVGGGGHGELVLPLAMFNNSRLMEGVEYKCIKSSHMC